MPVALFHLGRVVATPPCMQALETNGQGPREFLARHQAGDWGCVCDDDKKANDAALEDGSRLFSGYMLKDSVTKIWIITEANDDTGNRRSTCLLLPSDY